MNEIRETSDRTFELAALDRLRQSRASAATRRRGDGEEAGRTWARNHAEFEDLQRVAELCASTGVTEDVPYALVCAVLDDMNPSRTEVEETLEWLFGSERVWQEEAIGFINGASEVFDQV